MNTLATALQVIIALGIYNVWLLRFGKATAYRGGSAANMEEEFAAYGLPAWFMKVVGFFKLLFATLLLVGLVKPEVVQPAAIGMAALMVGAVVMHVKIQDPVKKYIPALTMLAMSLVLAAIA